MLPDDVELHLDKKQIAKGMMYNREKPSASFGGKFLRVLLVFLALPTHVTLGKYFIYIDLSLPPYLPTSLPLLSLLSKYIISSIFPHSPFLHCLSHGYDQLPRSGVNFAVSKKLLLIYLQPSTNSGLENFINGFLDSSLLSSTITNIEKEVGPKTWCVQNAKVLL